MTYAISLYDALTGINVPKPQALAVVEALEQKMTSELATKADIERLELATKSDFASVRADMAAEFASVRADMAADRHSMENRLTLRLGALIVTCATIIIGILQIS